MFEHRDLEPVPIYSYTISMVNYNRELEFFGIRTSTLEHVQWFIDRHAAVAARMYARERQADGFDPTNPSKWAAEIDLTQVISYWLKQQIRAGAVCPCPGYGGMLAIELGPGIFLTVQTLIGAEVPTCGPDEMGYN